MAEGRRPALNLSYLTTLWTEVLERRAELSANGEFDIKSGGTSAGNYGNLRIARQNYHTALHQDEITWLLTARLKIAEVAVLEPDDAPMIRKGLITLAATALAWVEELDSE